MKKLLVLLFITLSALVYAETEFVVVNGIGKNIADAKNNAFIAAVEQAVGVMVSAELLIKNGELIEDKIITKSQGFIEKYELISMAQDEQVYTVTIKALVSKAKLAKELEIITGDKVDVDGQSAAAKIVTSQKRYEDLLKDLPELLNTAGQELMSAYKVKIVKIAFDHEKAGKTIPFAITVQFYVDDERYSQSIKKLRQLFEEVGAQYYTPNFMDTGLFHVGLRSENRNLIDNSLVLVERVNNAYKKHIYVFSDPTVKIIRKFVKDLNKHYDRFAINFVNDSGIMESFTFNIRTEYGLNVFYTTPGRYDLYQQAIRPAIMIMQYGGDVSAENFKQTLDYTATGKVKMATVEAMTSAEVEIRPY